MKYSIKKITVSLLFIAITSIASSQEGSKPEINIKWENDKQLFYETPDLKKIEFTYTNFNETAINTWREKTKYSDAVKRIKFNKNNTGTIHFKTCNDINLIRDFFSSLSLTEFKVNSNLVLVEHLISIEDALKKADDIIIDNNFIFKAEYNDKTNIGYHNFQVYYAETKIRYMYLGNYPKYVFEGYMAKFANMLSNAKIEREAFIINSQNIN